MVSKSGASPSGFLRLAQLATRIVEKPFELKRLSVDRLLDEARNSAGLDDFGGSSFLEPFSQLVQSLESEARLTALGREVARARLRTHLSNRLRVQADRVRLPSIAREEIEQPIFIVGPPRTGTSILFRVLANHENALSPRAWQIQNPSPPPPIDHRRLDLRYLRAYADEIFLQLVLPDLRAIRDTRADLPEECCVLQAHAFVSILFAIAFDIPSYQRVLLEIDHRDSYDWHHAFLQQFQYGAGRRGFWVLKSPGHLLSFGALFARYPDACIVQTHRDPLDVIPSLASLSRVLRSLSTDVGKSPQLGESVASFWSTAIDRSLDFRESHPEREKSFFDVRFEEIDADPVAVARRIFAHFGRGLSRRSEARMSRYAAEHPKNRYGRHRYSLEEFGLNCRVEARRFERYRSRFGLDAER